MTMWTVEEAATLELDEPVSELHVRLVGGAVDVVASTGPSRIEVNDVDGLPVLVRLEDGVLTVGYDDVVWATILGWLRSERRWAAVSIAVPPECAVELGAVSAAATVTGMAAPTSVRSVSGALTLDGVSGAVDAETVSGSLETLSLDGELSFQAVSGSLTVAGGRTEKLAARTVSGSITLDLDPPPDAALSVETVSGEIRVRLPAAVSLEVDLKSTSGDIRTAHDGLELAKRPGRTVLAGRLGNGGARLRGRAVSGSIALLAGANA
jgi:Putative adhesin